MNYNTERKEIIKRELEKCFTHHNTLIDLGALEGEYSAIASHIGYKVTAIEARSSSVKKIVELSRDQKLWITVIQDDVKNIDKYKQFDVTLCLGLLYHLDNPVEFLTKLATKTKDTLILSTHFSLMDDRRYDLFPQLSRLKKAICKRIPSLFTKHNYGLGELVVNENHLGRWYREYNSRASFKEIDKLTLSSVSNHKSFWLNKDELLSLLNRLGFNVREVHNVERHDLSIFICKKT